MQQNEKNEKDEKAQEPSLPIPAGQETPVAQQAMVPADPKTAKKGRPKKELVISQKPADEKITEKTIDDFIFGAASKFTDQQKMLFKRTAVALQLNPFKKEIYALPFKDPNGVPQLSMVVGYEVYIRRGERSGMLNGWKVWTVGDDLPKMKACIEINRKDFKAPFFHEIFFVEYNQGNFIWQHKPRTMLKKVVISQGFRLAFPDECGGLPMIYEEDQNYIEGEIVSKPADALPAPADAADPAPSSHDPDEKMTMAVGDDLEVPIGKFKGTKFKDLPVHYLHWLEEHIKDPGRILPIIQAKVEKLFNQYAVELKLTDGDIFNMIQKEIPDKNRWGDLDLKQREQIVTKMHRRLKETANA